MSLNNNPIVTNRLWPIDIGLLYKFIKNKDLSNKIGKKLPKIMYLKSALKSLNIYLNKKIEIVEVQTIIVHLMPDLLADLHVY